MGRNDQHSEPGQTTYQIQVQGRLDERWSEWFDGMTIQLDQDDATSSITTLTGHIDQSALHGILARIRDLNLKLLSVTRVEKPHPQQEKKGK